MLAEIAFLLTKSFSELLENSHLPGCNVTPTDADTAKPPSVWHHVLGHPGTSSIKHNKPFNPDKIVFILFWNNLGALYMPNANLLK